MASGLLSVVHVWLEGYILLPRITNCPERLDNTADAHIHINISSGSRRELVARIQPATVGGVYHITHVR